MLRGSGDVQRDLPDYARHGMRRERAIAPDRHWPTRGLATLPRPPYTATLGVPGERTGPNANSASAQRRKEPSPVPDMVGGRKNMEIPIQYSNKVCINGTSPIPEEHFGWDFRNAL